MRSVLDRLAGVAVGANDEDGWADDARAAVPPEEVLSVHFSVNGRSHGMWFVDANAPPETVPVDLWAHWRETADDVWTGELLRGRRVLVDAVLCVGDAPGRRVRLRERLGAARAAHLVPLRQRPLLATFARGVDLSLDQARLAHQLLVRSAANAAGSWDDVLSPGLTRRELCCP